MIYFSFGMHKSGSTLAFELTKEMFEQAGAPQILLSKEIIGPNRGINFLRQPTPANIEALEKEVDRIGHPIVLKTHHASIPQIEALLESGKALGHCVYRDPRDIVLSLLDAGAKARQKGDKAFARIDSMERAMENVETNIQIMETWVHLPNVLPVNYTDLAFDTVSTVERFKAQCGLDIDSRRVAHAVNGKGLWNVIQGIFRKKPFTQFNKGIRDRYKSELSPAENEMLLGRFGDFIGEFCQPAEENSRQS